MSIEQFQPILDAIVQTVAESPEPVPASIIVIGLQSKGCPYDIANDMVNYLVRTGKLTRSNHQLTAPE